MFYFPMRVDRNKRTLNTMFDSIVIVLAYMSQLSHKYVALHTLYKKRQYQPYLKDWQNLHSLFLFHQRASTKYLEMTAGSMASSLLLLPASWDQPSAPSPLVTFRRHSKGNSRSKHHPARRGYQSSPARSRSRGLGPVWMIPHLYLILYWTS